MPATTSKLNDKEYSQILQKADFETASYEEIANSLMENGVYQMYHALVNEEDIQTLFTIPNLKIFWICRCHHVAKDDSTSHEHLHALVQYQNKKTHRAFKDRLKKGGQKLHPKTTFKKILCPDHAVGVLRYISCRDGQRATRRNGDGLMGAPHTHYRRSIFERSLLHRRSAKQIVGCKDIRLFILSGVRRKLTEDWERENVSGSFHHLHHHKTCLCDFGEVGIAKKKAANKKRSDFYETETGKEIKKKYKDRAQDRKEIIKKVMDLKSGSNLAELDKETIINLLKRMR